jgi:hypothetical protein
MLTPDGKGASRSIRPWVSRGKAAILTRRGDQFGLAMISPAPASINCPSAQLPVQFTRDGNQSMNQRRFYLGIYVRIYLGAALSVALSIMGQNGAFAQQGTPEQQAACQPDVMRLCGNFIPDVDRIVACLKYNEPNLNPACHDVMFPYVPEEPKPKAKAKAKPKPKKKSG